MTWPNSPFLDPSFYFDRYPAGVHWPTWWVIIGFFGLAVALGIALGVLRQRLRFRNDRLAHRTLERFGHWGWGVGLVGLLLAFFRVEYLPYFGMRIWTILWLTITLVWLVRILWYWLRVVPKLRRQAAEREAFRKYLSK